MPPLFSVVIPTFNRLKLLRQAVNSVLIQQLGGAEILVVDDGSTDDTLAWLNSQRPNLRFLTQRNRGPGAARNLGICYSTGRYVTFLDSDDLWFPWTLSTFASLLKREGEVAWIMGKSVEFCETDGPPSPAPVPVRYERFTDYLAASASNLWVGGCGVAIRRDLLDRAGGFTDRWINAEDSDLWLRLGTAHGFIAVQSPATMAYRLHPQTAVASSNRTYEGLMQLIANETEAKYPGDKARRLERLRILTRHTRPGTRSLMQAGAFREALSIYRSSFAWNARLGNWRYLVGFWLFLAGHAAILRSAKVSPHDHSEAACLKSTA